MTSTVHPGPSFIRAARPGDHDRQAGGAGRPPSADSTEPPLRWTVDGQRWTNRPVPRGVSRKVWARLTDFQRGVYQAVCRIPRGQVRSYQWVAERVGQPHAARAVGAALRRNPFAPRIPCHRVVRADGSLGGYSGGLLKKRALLKREGWSQRSGRPPSSVHGPRTSPSLARSG